MRIPIIIALRLSLILAISVICFLSFFKVLDYSLAFYVAAALGLVYVIVRSAEVRGKPLKMEGEIFRSPYLTNYMISKRIISVSFFVMVCVLLIAPETRIIRLVPVPASFAIGEALYFLLSLKRKNLAVIFFPDYIYFQQDREMKILATEVVHIEYRYENFYLVLLNKVTVQFNPEFFPEAKRQAFRSTFMNWAEQNRLPFTPEAIEKLGAEKAV